MVHLLLLAGIFLSLVYFVHSWVLDGIKIFIFIFFHNCTYFTQSAGPDRTPTVPSVMEHKRGYPCFSFIYLHVDISVNQN